MITSSNSIDDTHDTTAVDIVLMVVWFAAFILEAVADTDACAKGGSCNLARHGLHIWPRGTHFIMALANLDGSFTGTIYMVNEGDGDTFASLETEEAAAAFLEREYADALPFLGGALKIGRPTKYDGPRTTAGSWARVAALGLRGPPGLCPGRRRYQRGLLQWPEHGRRVRPADRCVEAGVKHADQSFPARGSST